MIKNGLNHPAGVILPAHLLYNLGRSISILCADYLGTNSDKLLSTFWDFIDNEYKTLCRQARQANQDPHEAPFPLTRMRQVLDTLALPLNKSWRLQQKEILLAVIGHQYALHKIRQLNNTIQANLNTVYDAVLLTDFQAQLDQAQAQVQAQDRARAQEPHQVYFGPLFYNQNGLTGQYDLQHQLYPTRHALVVSEMIINTQYTSDINLAKAIQISLIHQNHNHIQHDINEKVGFMYLAIKLHPHTIFHPPGKCNQFTFQTQYYPKTEDIAFILPNCISPGAIYAIKPHVMDNPNSHFHDHWVLTVATKDVPNVQEFDRWSQNWNNDPIPFTLIQPYTYIDANGPQVDMPGRIIRVQVFHSNQGRCLIFNPRQI